MYLLVEQLLYEEHVSFLLTVPAHAKLRNVASILTIYVAFLVGCNDSQYRMAYELLHRMSTLCRQFENNEKNGRMYEHSCPGNHCYEEPFSHFAFGWSEGESGGPPSDLAETGAGTGAGTGTPPRSPARADRGSDEGPDSRSSGSDSDSDIGDGDGDGDDSSDNENGSNGNGYEDDNDNEYEEEEEGGGERREFIPDRS
jgi:hypothetical protein